MGPRRRGHGRLLLAAILFAGSAATLHAETLVVAPVDLPEWKAVYGRVEARDSIPARARLGGTLVDLSVTEGDEVAAGDVLARVRDEKIDFQIAALDAQIRALKSQLDNAETELGRGETLLKRGIVSSQQLDQLRTTVDVARNQLASTQAQRQVVVQQAAEGDVLAPASGRVIVVPVTRGAVVMAGESVATVAGGGFFLRLAIPERHARMLKQGAPLEIGTQAGPVEGRLARIYPQIENGRVVADVEVAGLDTEFVDARLLVRVPIGSRKALLVPEVAVATRAGIDLVTVKAGEGESERAVVTGRRLTLGGERVVEILTGLAAGAEIVIPDAAAGGAVQP